MDKYEYKVKLDQIEKMASKKDYVTAAKIADGIDWRKVKSVTTLTMIADIYEATDRLEDCYELLNMVYDRSPMNRRVVYRLAQVAVKMHDFEEAIDLYKEFIKMAPHDLNQYILKYQICRERGSSIEEQIRILEEFKSHEYDEKWAYELACLYEEAGQIEYCVAECDELILWYSEGEYVVKALELKQKYQNLTAAQQEKYEHRFDYLEKETEEPQYFDEDKAENEPVEDMQTETVLEDNISEESDSVASTENVVEPAADENVQAEEQDDTPTVSMVNTEKYNTINLQEELAKGIQMFLTDEDPADDVNKEDTQEFIPVKEPVKTVTEQSVQLPEEQEVTAAEPQEFVKMPVEETEMPAETASLSETAQIQNEILKYATVKQERKMEDLLQVEEDGQLSLIIGEENVAEKQITGQMTIEEILEAWEETKRQAREQIANAENSKQAVPFETGEITSILQDFIPKTPKEVPEMTELEEAESKVTEPEVIEPEVTEPEAMEDDLPIDIDIDLEEALENVLEETHKEMPETVETKAEEKAEESVETQTTVTESAETEKEVTVGQNTASMVDAIEQALAAQIGSLGTAGQYMTEEQEKIFAYFTSVSGMKKQLLALLREEHLYVGRTDSGEGNLIITGHPGNGKTTLAIDIVKALQKQRREKGGKLAKVTGDGMNKKDPAEVVKKLGGGALIIERAGSLKDDTVEKLSAAMEGTTGGLLVILEDDLEEIQNLLNKNVGFAAKFTRSVDIPIFSNDELVAFGKSYAEEKEYYFDEMAVLALYDSIGVRQTADHVVNITEVKEFVDDAIAHAEKKSKGFFAKFSKKRIDEYGNKLLLEEDFDY